MARKKNPTLPDVTDEDLRERPQMLRKTPKGGWAWKCQHCGQYASSQLRSGAFVCYRHGGGTKASRDVVARMRALERGEAPPRPAGRPAKTGFYSTGETINIDKLVAEYRAQGLDPDDTDEDMLYLRAYLAELKELKPAVDRLKDELEPIVDALAPFRELVLKGAEGMTIDELMDQLPALRELKGVFGGAERLLKQLALFTEGLEARHATIITMAKQRAETRLKNKAAQELTVFSAMLVRLNIILSEVMPPPAYQALQKRFERDLKELPKRMLEYPALMADVGSKH